MEKKKIGGRKPGSKNKATEVSRNIINGIVGDYIESGLMHKDFAALDSRDRLEVIVKLLKFIVPQPKEVALDINSPNTISIEDTLIRLSKEQQ